MFCFVCIGVVVGERFGHVALRLLGISTEPVRLARKLNVRLFAIDKIVEGKLFLRALQFGVKFALIICQTNLKSLNYV